MTACAVVGGFALAACGNNNGHSNDGGGANGSSFAPIDAASTDAAKRAVIGTDFATIAGKTRETGYVTILRSGERRGSSADLNTFGQIVDDSNTPILKADGSTTIADSNDFSSILKVGGNLYATSQFSSQRGAQIARPSCRERVCE